MKIKIVLIILCVASTTQTGAMQEVGQKRMYNEAATQRLQWILSQGWFNYRDEVPNLLDNGADPDIQVSDRRLIPQATNDFHVLEKALKCGGNPNWVNEYGDTAFHIILRSHSYIIDKQKVAALLLLAGISSTIKNKYDKTALGVLEDNHPKEIPIVQAVIAAAPLVKQEREAYNPGVAQLINAYLLQPITDITIDFVGSRQVWDEGCWDLFQKHMASARNSNHTSRN